MGVRRVAMLLSLLGAVAVVVGVGMYSAALAWIAAGALGLACGMFMLDVGGRR